MTKVLTRLPCGAGP